MSVHSRPSMKYQDGMELRDRKMTKDCTQPLRIGNIRALNGIKYKSRKLVLDDLTGICRYQTQTHEGVVPLKINESGKSIALWDLNLNFQQFYLFQYL